jgi:S-adenosylmethionine:tRNA ribosyltransferase-isomerase
MNFYNQIYIKNYIYLLPDSKIAKYPLPERDSSKLLVFKDGNIWETLFSEIDNYLTNNSLIVFNTTKVIQARLLFEKESGAKIEIFCLEPFLPSDYEMSFQSKQKVQWKCIIGNAKKWKLGKISRYFKWQGNSYQIQATKLQQLPDAWIVELEWNGLFSFSEIIEINGLTPIPPYLNRESEELDKSRYQTIYSKHKGSVAAPTAGLHFTEKVFSKLKKKNINISEISLHVGAGTFKPVKTDSVSDHEMHTEHFIVNKDVIMNLLENTGKIIAVGTTSVRTLESVYWLGVKVLKNNKLQSKDLHLNQWEVYHLQAKIEAYEALRALYNYLELNDLDYIEATTQIMIVPGYKFKIVNVLITNFHQPQSTLLLLIAAFIGEKWKEVYNFAIENNFRFLSYGDSSLLIP